MADPVIPLKAGVLLRGQGSMKALGGRDLTVLLGLSPSQGETADDIDGVSYRRRSGGTAAWVWGHAPALAREAAVVLGVTLIDTAYLYGGGANEELLAEALHPYPDGLLITTKVGVARSGSAGEWKLDGRPAGLQAQVEQALRRLRVERIELLQLHRIDPETPLVDQLGTLRDLRAEGQIGQIGQIGLSEVTVTELNQAREIVDVASVQNRYNVLDREHEPVLSACERAEIAFLPWRRVAAGTSGEKAQVAAVAAELGATPTQIALAWLLDLSPVMLPIPGTARVSHLEENLAAEGIRLTPAHRARLDQLHQVA